MLIADGVGGKTVAEEVNLAFTSLETSTSLGMRTIFFFLLSCLAAASAFMPAAIQQPAAFVRRASGLAMEVGQNYVVRVEIELEQGEP